MAPPIPTSSARPPRRCLRDLPAAELLRRPGAAPDLAAANEAGALPVAHVDPLSLGVLEAPGAYGAALAIGEGQPADDYQAYGGPHYGFIASRAEYVRHPAPHRRRDHRRRRQARLCLDPADPRTAHPPREGHLEHHDESDAAGARRARLPLVARASGAARSGGDLHGPRRVCEERLELPLLFAEQTTFKVCRAGRTARRATSSARLAPRASIPATR